MIDGRFLAGLLLVAALGGLAAWPLVDHLNGGPAGLLAGIVFSVVSLGLGHHWIRRSARRAPGRFVGAGSLRHIIRRQAAFDDVQSGVARRRRDADHSDDVDGHVISVNPLA